MKAYSTKARSLDKCPDYAYAMLCLCHALPVPC